jgi:Hypothetical glycosyl hydrolase 6/Beta-galactosidase trimerisation domain
MKKISITRRDFIGTSLLGAGAVITRGPGPIFMQAGAPPEVEMWYNRTMRWVQLVLTEGDTGQYDPKWWIDLFKRTHTDGLCLVAGGVTAFYPTRIPFHRKAYLMGDGDMFGDIVRPCQKMGMTIVARTDSQACLADAAAAHPEWLNIDENGKPRPLGEFAPPGEERTVTCAMGDYNFDFMTRVHREIFEMYQIDGLFTNRWQAQDRGMCYCETCQRLFRDFSGMELPRGNNSPAQMRYTEWETARLTELWKLWDGEIRKIKPTARYFSNTGIDINRAAELAPTYICEVQSRGSGAPWSFGNQGKQMRTIFGPKKKILGLGGMTLSSRHSIAPEAEVKLWLLSSITDGLSPWLIKSSARNWDKRWIPAIEKVYNWHYSNEKYMRNEENLARVAMLFMASEPRNPLSGTSIAAGAATGAGVAARARGAGAAGSGQGAATAGANAATGMYQALVESRIPFEMAYSLKLESADIDRYKLLIMPNITNISDAVCEKLRQYVNRGGSLLATFQTSLFSGGAIRPNFGLSDLFGVAYAGSIESNGSNAYIRLEHDTKHPILKGLEEAQQVVSTNSRVNVQAVATFPYPPLTRIPNYPTRPMEQIFPLIPKTDIPEVYPRIINERSRVVYFPGDIDSTFANSMATDLAALIRNSVSWAMNEPQVATVIGPGILNVTCWRQANSMTVHMLNCTNPFMLRSSYREDIPIGPQKVTIRIPAGRNAGAVKLTVAGVTPKVEREGNILTLTVPSIVDHEVVAIDFS